MLMTCHDACNALSNGSVRKRKKKKNTYTEIKQIGTVFFEVLKKVNF